MAKKKTAATASFSFRKLNDKIDTNECQDLAENCIAATDALDNKVDDIERKLTEALKRADSLDGGFECSVNLNVFEDCTHVGLNDKGEVVVVKSPTKRAKQGSKERIVPFGKLETLEIACILTQAEVPDPSGATCSIMQLIDACQNAED